MPKCPEEQGPESAPFSEETITGLSFSSGQDCAHFQGMWLPNIAPLPQHF